MAISSEDMLNILVFLDRKHLDQLCVVSGCLKDLIQKCFSSKPYRLLNQFTSYPTTFTIDFKHKSSAPACKSFASFRAVSPFISPTNIVRANSSCVYFTANQQIQKFIQQFKQCAHLWLDSYLCLVFDGFNELTDGQARHALQKFLREGIYCNHLTVAMMYDCSTPFYLSHFSSYSTKFDMFTVKIMGQRIVQEDLLEYLHSTSLSGAGYHMLSIFFYLTKQVDEWPSPYGEWQGFQLGRLLCKLKEASFLIKTLTF